MSERVSERAGGWVSGWCVCALARMRACGCVRSSQRQTHRVFPGAGCATLRGSGNREAPPSRARHVARGILGAQRKRNLAGRNCSSASRSNPAAQPTPGAVSKVGSVLPATPLFENEFAGHTRSPRQCPARHSTPAAHQAKGGPILTKKK